MRIVAETAGVYYSSKDSKYGSVGEVSDLIYLKCIIGERACYLTLEKRRMGPLKRVSVREVLRTSHDDDDEENEINIDGSAVVHGSAIVRFVIEEERDRKGRVWYKMVEHSADDIVMVSEGGEGTGLVQGFSFTDGYSNRDGLLHLKKIQNVAGLITRLQVRYIYLINKKGFSCYMEIYSSRMDMKYITIKTQFPNEVYDDMIKLCCGLTWKTAATPEHNRLNCIYPFPFPYSQPLSYFNYNNRGTQNLNGPTNASGSTTGILNHAAFVRYYYQYNLYH
ncbi:hypothetical protein O6P43_003637 [Quillaja saponaria]|uniref:Uncharacterized protein n=1 Tax=Quillaja saponaria TaxID=32244 RepID=A0AAD7QF91_QUISA|nr:hypothetical protein O6P43_003637 [Quillaja saponaria]